ncbi:FtsH protease activity modulator HflK [Aliidiomarina halalkaliphila]|uniref:Protein HflK n=1 Tax=Aliidiomarina halalkaliphila TaxID=2593535 RepID=A0A552X1Z9_9GAMM|nr:FtsH protease activity modulator HflK [Aliidiomarina halalkaliphila]TRW49044.1 FtsH protease activity modulator HflK [Aliidiomarina halalkaliphila]
MAWNQPGNSGKDKDPWGNNQGGRDQGPPDLDEALRSLMSKLGLGGGKGGQGGSGGSTTSGIPGKVVGFALVLVAVIWFIAGFYTVREAERGVIQRFGAYHAEVTSGLHWRPYFIDQVTNVDVNNVFRQETGGFMLTEDENVVRVELAVQYRVANARAYLFNVENPDSSLSQITDSALRYVIGHNTMDNILTVGREEIRQQTWEIIDRLIERYDVGLRVIDVNFLGARPPEEVREAFDDAIRAQEDQERFVREAEAYAREIEPTARGRVRRLQQEAQAYKEQMVLRATGEVARFNELLPQYQAAPEVTRQRIFLETLERIYADNAKIFIDVDGSNNMMYLPLDKILEQHGRSRAGQNLPMLPSQGQNGVASPTGTNSSQQDLNRGTTRSSTRGGN